MKHEYKISQKGDKERKDYESPVLRNWGQLKDVTQSGAGPRAENTGNDSMPNWQVHT